MFMKGLSSGKFRLELGQRWAESNVWLTEILRVNIICPPPGWGPWFLQNSKVHYYLILFRRN